MWFSRATRVPRILRACAVGAGLVTFTADAQAQSAADKYPDKPIKIIVPFAPGGSADILSRVVGNKLTESFGQTIVVETRPGRPTSSPIAMTSGSPFFRGMALPPSSRPVRIFGPPRSCRIATSLLARRAAARTRANVAACDSCVPWEKLRRKTSTPASMSRPSTSGARDAGPIVATILVRLMVGIRSGTITTPPGLDR